MIGGRLRDRAMFDLAIDSKLRGCDMAKIKIGDLVSGGRVRSRAIVVQQKTGRSPDRCDPAWKSDALLMKAPLMRDP